VKSPFGYHIIKLLDRIPPGERTIERLKPELVYQWRKDVSTAATRIEKFTKEGEALLNIFKASVKDGAFVSTKRDPKLSVTETSFVSQGETIQELPNSTDSAALWRAAQPLKAKEVSPMIRGLNQDRVYLVRVADIRPAKTPELSEVREKILADVAKKKQDEALNIYAKDLAQKWSASKKPISQVAKEIGLAVEETGDFTRTGDHRIPKIGVTATGMNEAFLRSLEDPILPTPIAVGEKLYLAALSKRSAPDWKKFDEENMHLAQLASDEAGRQRNEALINYVRSKSKIQQSLAAATTN
jgi:hypothetical protein